MIYFGFSVGRRTAVKVVHLSRLMTHVNLPRLVSAIKVEVKMAYRLREAKKHVINMYDLILIYADAWL